MADVFVSYSRVNRDRATGVGAALEAAHYKVWWDKHLLASSYYAVPMESGIDAASCVVAWPQR